jgi:hypothetical protein
MNREYFTAEEAQAKVGQRIQALREFSRIPLGTTGIVIETDQAFPTAHSLVIQWDVSNERREEHLNIGGEPVLFVAGGKPLVDWFSRDEYETYLREV